MTPTFTGYCARLTARPAIAILTANAGQATLLLLLRRQVLELMGCHVTQTATSTTVHGPSDGRLHPIQAVCRWLWPPGTLRAPLTPAPPPCVRRSGAQDMGNMSDAFMTAAVLMAATPVGAVSRITNIANQRAKESNRIAVMVAELAKLGVVARELPDGLEVEGAALDRLKPAVIDCHDDHRIAMAFAVLACRVPGLVIADKGCVAKTYPTFWDDLQRGLGVRLAVPDAEAQERARELRLGIGRPAASVGGRPLEASVVLIGLRGAGKTTLGRAAAAALGRDFIVRPPRERGMAGGNANIGWELSVLWLQPPQDMDAYFVERRGEAIAAFVEREGWPAFRSAEVALLKEARRAMGERCVNGFTKANPVRTAIPLAVVHTGADKVAPPGRGGVRRRHRGDRGRPGAAPTTPAGRAHPTSAGGRCSEPGGRSRARLPRRAPRRGNAALSPPASLAFLPASLVRSCMVHRRMCYP